MEIEPIDRIRIIKHEPGNLESHSVLAVVPLRFPRVPFEFVVAHPILVGLVSSKLQAAPRITTSIATTNVTWNIRPTSGSCSLLVWQPRTPRRAAEVGKGA